MHLDPRVDRLVRERPERVDPLVHERVELRRGPGCSAFHSASSSPRAPPRALRALAARRPGAGPSRRGSGCAASGVASRSSSASSTRSVTNAATWAGSRGRAPCRGGRTRRGTPSATHEPRARARTAATARRSSSCPRPPPASAGSRPTRRGRATVGACGRAVSRPCSQLEETLTPSPPRSPMSLVAASALSLAFGPKVVLDRRELLHRPARPDRPRRRERHRQVVAPADPRGDLAPGRRRARVPARRARRLPAAGRRRRCPTCRSSRRSSRPCPGRAALEERLLQAEAALAAAREPAEQLELSQALAELHEELDHFEEHYGRRRAERILAGLGFAARRPRPPRPHLLRRLEDARRARRAPPAGPRPAAPRRADQPPRRPDAGVVRRLPARHAQGAAPRHPRPRVPEPADRPGPLARAGGAPQLRGRLRRLPAPARRGGGAARGAGQAPGRRSARSSRPSSSASARRPPRRRRRSRRRSSSSGWRRCRLLEHRATLRFRFAEAPRSGREVLRLEGLSKAFGPRIVYRRLDAAVQRGERVGVIGPNGAGKTTLLKLVAGELRPTRAR